MDKVQEFEKRIAELEEKQQTTEKKLHNMSERLQRQEQLMQTVFSHIGQLYAAQNIEQTISIVGNLGKDMLEAEKCDFWYAETTNKFFTADENGNRQYSKASESIKEAITSGKPIVNGDEAVIPVQTPSGDTMGVVVAEKGNFDAEVLKKFEINGEIGAVIKLGLEKERQHQISITDKLTQMKNRVGLNEHSNNFIVPSMQQDKPITVIMCDIDHFKSVNDTYGHDAGDKVLRHVADIIRDNIRSRENSNDEAFRLGGEEFVIAFDNTEKVEAFHISDRIRQAIENSPCDIGNGQKINVTISMGVEQLKASPDISKSNIMSVVDAAIQSADKNLYEAKETGRNQVIAKLDNGEKITAITDIPKEAKYTKIIGNTEYYKLGAKADLQYFSNLNNRHAENIARELNKQGIQFSGVVIDTKTTITVNKTDAKAVYAAEDKCKALYSNRTSKSDLAEKQNKAEKAIEQQERNKDTKGER